MESIELPEYEAVALDNIAPDVAGMRILFVNVYGIRTPDAGWTLIDTGLYLSSSKIKKWAESQFGEARPRAIVLTHGHFDHTGTVEDLAKEWDVPVYAHSQELRFLTGDVKYPPPDPTVGGGLMAVMSPLYPRTSANLAGRVMALPADGSVPTLPGWRWIHTPGHAPGHVSLFREADRLLIVGDAFCTTDNNSLLAVARQKPELSGPPAYYTPDWDAASESVQKLAELQPRTVAPGHGLPMSGDQLASQLQQFAQRFDQIARPEHGKYVREATGG
jgi:glyoxylase-like metal-dependent hydrolase (beta-lactamase superfamily II)